jgi:type I restriction enzyme S subunit
MTAVPAGYKQTEVGVIPEEWEIKAIRSVCKLINGRGFKPHEWKKAGLPIIRIQNLNGSEEFNYYQGVYDRKLEIDAGQLLFAWSGSRGTSFGPHVWAGARGLLNYHTWKVQVNDSEITPSFFFHALKKLTEFIEGRAHGASGLVHTQKWEMEGFSFPLPSKIPEQRAIATALSDVDALLTKLDQLIAKKCDLKQATMQQLLTGQTRLPGFSREWEVKRLGDVLRVRHGKRQRGVETHDGRYPILATGGEIGRADTFLYDKPSVLIGRKGTIDRPQFRDEPFWTVDTLFYTEIFDANSPKFLFYKFNMIDWQNYNEASGVPSLNAATIESIEIILPYPEEQTAIATVLSDMDADIAALEARRDKTRALKQGMMQELLTGRIRLV